jgi:predicted aspartyl protease
MGELMLVEAELRGPRSTLPARLVFDTGATSTTLVPEFIEDLGYSARDGVRFKRMHTALSEEEGYTLKVAEFSVLSVTTPDFMIHVFDLGHEGFDGLLGMNFLRHFNFEVRPGDQKIIVELISGGGELVDDEDAG